MNTGWITRAVLAALALSAVQCGNTSADVANVDSCIQGSCTDKVLSDAAAALQQSSTAIGKTWAAYCNAVNADLALDTSHTDYAGACGVVNSTISTAMAKGVTVMVTLSGVTCQGTDALLEAQCQAGCANQAGCDPASCESGKLANACDADGGCISYCTGKLACDATGLLVPACHALGSAMMTCTGTLAVHVSGDDALALVLEKHAAEYASVQALSEEFDKLIDAILCPSQGSQCAKDACDAIGKARVLSKPASAMF